MIPTYLEKMVHEKKAKFGIFNHAYSAVGIIPVPKGHYIILSNFLVHSWTPYAILDTHNLPIINQRCWFRISFISKTDTFTWILKNDFECIGDDASTLVANPIGKNSIDCYCLFDSNVTINISRISRFDHAVLDIQTLRPNAQNPAQPKGYGTTEPVIVRAVLESTLEYRPQGAEANPTLGTPTATYNQQMEELITVDTSLTVESNVNTNDPGYPLVNCHYFLINEKYRTVLSTLDL